MSNASKSAEIGYKYAGNSARGLEFVLACNEIADWKDAQVNARLEDVVREVQRCTAEGLYNRYIVKRIKELLNR